MLTKCKRSVNSSDLFPGRQPLGGHHQDRGLGVYSAPVHAQAALREAIGNGEMDSVVTEREQIAESVKRMVGAETSGWGTDVESIKI